MNMSCKELIVLGDKYANQIPYSSTIFYVSPTANDVHCIYFTAVNFFILKQIFERVKSKIKCIDGLWLNATRISTNINNKNRDDIFRFKMCVLSDNNDFRHQLLLSIYCNRV